MRDFAAIDFETANNERTSVCSVGVVIVRDGEIVDSFYSPDPSVTFFLTKLLHFARLVRCEKFRCEKFRITLGRAQRFWNLLRLFKIFRKLFGISE